MANRITTALEPHYHRIGTAPNSRWNSGMEIKTAEQAASRLIPAQCERGDAR
jgi:hypothetical protein